MPRRDDGSAIRYEFQIFDTPKGNMIADYLDGLKEEGGSVAAFVREALFFYIQYLNQGQNPAGFVPYQDDLAASPSSPPTDFRSLVIDEDEDEIDLEIREVSDGSSAQNFLNSMLGLQQKDS